MTPPNIALPTETELTNYIGALKTDEQQHSPETFPAPRWPSYRGGPELDLMTENEYRFGQADYDTHVGGDA
ncbi:hypothetical protein HNP84_010276 [Thermocatellispora tengchongensis]|uniref:Uncharacterized protein n=1 Tax=Thermocatellispora tengchongensis TaxID=1073253 RepID=A0A840PLY8_9ACTN|nr:hypothetical protein [Thermocatellispora tengchongensis]MBB5140508.1 hypothetical protein [Thermocatellispora tengchongensis]